MVSGAASRPPTGSLVRFFIHHECGCQEGVGVKLITYRTPAGLRLGVVTVAGVLDVRAATLALGMEGVPGDMAAVLKDGSNALTALDALVARAIGLADRGAALFCREEELNMAPCVPNPGKIIGVGLNYRGHARELGMRLPTTPMLFGKFRNALAGHDDPVAIPEDVEELDYEAELAFVIGRHCRKVTEEDALGYVFGYCNGNDISARDLQRRTTQVLLGKSPDGFCPIGPHLVTADEVPNPNALDIECYVNGEKRQHSNTADMVFPCRHLISYISRYMTLEPGDLILTGTPAGVALSRPDMPWLQPGDRVTVQIDGLGTLTNLVTRPSCPSAP